MTPLSLDAQPLAHCQRQVPSQPPLPKRGCRGSRGLSPARPAHPNSNSAVVPRGDWIRVGLCYPRGTSFSILSDVHNRLLKQTSKTGTFARTLQMEKVEQSVPGRSHYYWDEASG